MTDDLFDDSRLLALFDDLAEFPAAPEPRRVLHGRPVIRAEKAREQ